MSHLPRSLLKLSFNGVIVKLLLHGNLQVEEKLTFYNCRQCGVGIANRQTAVCPCQLECDLFPLPPSIEPSCLTFRVIPICTYRCRRKWHLRTSLPSETRDLLIGGVSGLSPHHAVWSVFHRFLTGVLSLLSSFHLALASVEWQSGFLSLAKGRYLFSAVEEPQRGSLARTFFPFASACPFAYAPLLSTFPSPLSSLSSLSLFLLFLSLAALSPSYLTLVPWHIALAIKVGQKDSTSTCHCWPYPTASIH